VGRLDRFAVLQHQAAQPPAAIGAAGLDLQVHDADAEAVFAPEPLDLGAHPFHHRHQPEGADVGL
jgi:hypothetical protein